MIKKNTFVLIKKVILTKLERSSNIPEDTKQKDFLMKLKGYLTHEAKIGDEVEILTETKRLVKGILIEVNPSYTHSYGNYLYEVKKMKDIILSEMGDKLYD